MAQPTFWEKTKTNSKAGYDKAWDALVKLGGPINRLSNKLGAEATWPMTIDKESEKAARILRSFCKDGFYDDVEQPTLDTPSGKQRVIKKIPTSVIQNAKGLAIFSSMRTGFWISGAGGTGVVVARKEDGTWSDPSGIMMHTVGFGFLIGFDIYDCVLVLNSQKAVDAFTRLRWTLGGELSAVGGPYGAGAVLDTEVHKRQYPIFSYIKSRGLYAGAQVDGTVVIERNDENELYYGEKLTCGEILAGKNRRSPYELKTLHATLKAAQGDAVDPGLLPAEPPPGDYEVEAPGHVFGVPDKEDPDPFGLHALEQEGIVVNDAATHKPVPEAEFAFEPSEKSPVYTTFHRKSVSISYSADGGSPDRQNGSVLAHREQQFSPIQLEGTRSRPPVKRVLRAPPPLPPRRPTQTDTTEKAALDMKESQTETEETLPAYASSPRSVEQSPIQSRSGEDRVQTPPATNEVSSVDKPLAEPTIDRPVTPEPTVASGTEKAEKSPVAEDTSTKSPVIETKEQQPIQLVDKEDTTPGAFN